MTAAEKKPADESSRQRIRNDLDSTLLVEAAAGTGKTTSLVTRILNLVRTGRAMPSTIAAITFTVKAAAHLRERLQEELERAIRTANADGVEGRLREALAGIDRGFIGTTHAFCARLLRERPVEAGLDPEFEELDAPAAVQLASEFWNGWYDAHAAMNDPAIAAARAVNLNRALLRESFLNLVDYPDVELVSQQTPRPDLRAMCDQICAFLDECEPHLPTDAIREKPDEFEVMIRHLIQLRESMELNTLWEQLRFLDEANHRSSKPVQKRWPDKATAKRLGDDYHDIIDNSLRPGLRRWYEHVHGVAMAIVGPAVAEFAEVRRRNGTLTFQDLLLAARDMLRDHPTVRRYFQQRFTHVLVDEFQDTDPLQAEVLFYLTGEDVKERNWRALRPRPGSLFIVGDPKQAIYRFRRADITTYLEVRKRIVDSGGHVVKLSTNFRSAPAVCTFVNGAFKDLFTKADVDAGLQAAHVDLEGHREPAAPVGVYRLETQGSRAPEAAENEAACIADWIDNAVTSGMTIDDSGESRPIRWGDVMLVSWQKPRLSFYARALEQRRIPYQITGSRAFTEESALTQVLPLLHAVVAPEDKVSILAFLRGALCGADDDALYRYVRAGGRFSPFAEPPAETDERIVRGLKLIRAAIEDARELPPAATMARLFDRLGVIADAAAGEQPGTSAGNLLLALSIARQESARGTSLAGIVEMLEEWIDSRAEIEELDVDPARTNAVRLMNLHQVKGLEAPVVFLIDPNDEYDFPVDLYIDRSGEVSRAHVAIRTAWGRSLKDVGLPVDWDSHHQQESAYREAEKKRQLYVAATRARNLLVIGFRQTAKGIVGAWRELASRAKEPLFAAQKGKPAPIAAGVVRQFDSAMAEMNARFDTARASSYSVLPITKVAHPDHQKLVRAEEGLGKGTSWGRVLHRLFEAMLRDANLDVRRQAENLLKDEERDPVELEEVLRVVEAVRSSPLWQRVLAADERFVEVPFALTVPRRDVGLPEDGHTLLHGAIDLVFCEKDRWFVVDYKSDATSGRLDALVEYYKPQVEHYARFWQQLTGVPTSAGLFFVDGCVERWV